MRLVRSQIVTSARGVRDPPVADKKIVFLFSFACIEIELLHFINSIQLCCIVND